jgi:hypothetical protein
MLPPTPSADQNAPASAPDTSAAASADLETVPHGADSIVGRFILRTVIWIAGIIVGIIIGAIVAAFLGLLGLPFGETIGGTIGGTC